ncbi:hypothetical protein CQW23_28182 [Capsicum baccatum]|uniref:Uncharacterized protein n=1 Tax=Capsicum baccatum TaxID=33114 RepID=A0A2G2VFS6_CAPBA|nr:hypothetical protein CQW23_28182 [Capsicum baccatum]
MLSLRISSETTCADDSNLLDRVVDESVSRALLGECVEIELLELVLLILLSQVINVCFCSSFLLHMWTLKQSFVVLLSVGIVWAFAALLTVAGYAAGILVAAYKYKK